MMFAYSALLISRLALPVSLLSHITTDVELHRPKCDCAQNFQVWYPDQEMRLKLQKLATCCGNISQSIHIQMTSLRRDVLTQLLSASNISYHFERELLQRKLKDAQFTNANKDVKLELMQIQNENVKVWDAIKGLRTDRRMIATESDFRQDIFATRDGDVDDAAHLQKLKIGIGDLKAEWVLIKREILGMKEDHAQSKSWQTNMKSDVVSLKRSLSHLSADMKEMRRRQEEFASQSSKVKSSVDSLQLKLANNAFNSSSDTQDSTSAQLRNMKLQIERQMESLSSSVHRMRKNNEATLAAVKEVTSSKRVALENASYRHNNKHRHEIQMQDWPKDCNDVYRLGHVTSGVYRVKPMGAAILDDVYCEMVNGSGWTLLQRRLDATINFNRRWREYKYGFANLYGEFWLGNQRIHHLTQQGGYRLHIDFWDWDGLRAYASYDSFSVGPESKKYDLHVSGYSGNAGDSLSSHDGVAFSTPDQDNDGNLRNCAMDNKGGWWFDSCYSSHLNGIYHQAWYKRRGANFADGIVWFTYKLSELYSLKRVEMKIAPAMSSND